MNSGKQVPADGGALEGAVIVRSVGLRYVNDDEPGYSRRRHGRGFAYRDADGRPVSDRPILVRLKALAIPPAWTNVWICADDRGHVQATGRDARGRKQYRYHPDWRRVRDAVKYERTIAFAQALPRLRRKVRRDLARRGLPRRKVLAAIIRLLDLSLLRVGNEEYARENRSFGLTTLRDRHASVRGATFKLSFRGKGGKRHEVGLRDRRLARIVKQCQELPGQNLFQYLDEDGRPQSVASDDVNAYLREAMGDNFSAKDFRTWAGTVLAARALREQAEDLGGPPAKILVRVVETVARALGNTPSVCRSSYIHPAVIEAHLDGKLASLLQQRAREDSTVRALQVEERLTLRLLRRRPAAGRSRSAASAA